MFNEGGLNQEGGMVDEVSGNEVPMGSTREEVRDDIPAQVSEGEFIFPADVTRFIGLDKLMQLRQKAKMGLKQMDAMGQMGNSDEATMPDDMPFGMADLVVIDGPDEDVPSGMHKMPDGSLMEDSEMPQKKAKGGLAFANGGISMPDFDRSNQDVRIYVKEGSPDKRIPFFNGEPVISIENLLAQGYVLKGSEPVDETKTETEEAIPTRRISDRTPMKKTPFQEAGGWGMQLGDPPDPAKVKLWTDEYAKTAGNTPAILTGIATVLGGPFGILVHMANKMNAKSAAANYEIVLKAAQQTNVAGQVKALQDINKAVKEGGDKSLLGKAIDGLKNAFGLSDEQADKATITAGRAGNTVPIPPTRPQSIIDADNVNKAAVLKEGAASADALDQENTAINLMGDKTEEAIPTSLDIENVVANERDFESKGTSPVRLMGDQIEELAAELELGPNIKTQLDPLTYNNMVKGAISIKSGKATAQEAINIVNPDVGLILKNGMQNYFSGGIDPKAPFLFTDVPEGEGGASTGVSRNKRSNEEIVKEALNLFDPASKARIDAGTNRFEPQEMQDKKIKKRRRARAAELRANAKNKIGNLNEGKAGRSSSEVAKGIVSGKDLSTGTGAATEGGAELDKKYGITGLNKGGLASRRKKK